MINIKSPECPGCKTTVTIPISEEGYTRYTHGALIQHAFPELSKDIRERFISGYCSECWDKLFEDDDNTDYQELEIDPEIE